MEATSNTAKVDLPQMFEQVNEKKKHANFRQFTKTNVIHQATQLCEHIWKSVKQ